MIAERDSHTATLLADGRVLVVGGADLMDGIDNLATAEIYDPATGKFTRTGSMAHGRAEHTATLLADGRVLVAGGIDDWGGLATTQIYSPSVNRWSRGNDLPVERAGQVAVRLPSGAVLLVGGYRWLPTYTTVATAVRYQP